MDFLKFFSRGRETLMLGLDLFTTDETQTLSCRTEDVDLMTRLRSDPVDAKQADPVDETETFTDVAEAAWAFRRKADRLVADGFVEIEKGWKGEDKPKEDWKRALDTVVIAVSADLSDQAALIAAFAATAYSDEPEFVRAQVGRELQKGGLEDLAAAASVLAAAEDLVRTRLDADTPTYAFMHRPRQLASAIARLRALVALNREDSVGALAAAKAACDWVSTWENVLFKLSLQMQAGGPELEAALAELYEHRDIPKLAPLKEVPDYADYAARRDRERTARQARGDTFEWSEIASPSSHTDVAAAETALGVTLPRDYKNFLYKKGSTRMRVESGTETSGVVFIEASQLVRERENFRRFTRYDLTIYGDGNEIEGEVGLDDLLPIADCEIQSNSILMQPQGEGGARYFAWFHDGQCELYPVAESFAELIFRLQQGASSGDRIVRSFYVFPHEDE